MDHDFAERPWIELKSTYDVEAWIDNYNRDLQRVITTPYATGCGVCFGLEHGGDIFMHTTADGDIVLDVTPEAQWVAPIIGAATGSAQPSTQIWELPGHTLTQLIYGLSSLIRSTRIVVNHDFKRKKY